MFSYASSACIYGAQGKKNCLITPTFALTTCTPLLDNDGKLLLATCTVKAYNIASYHALKSQLN